MVSCWSLGFEILGSGGLGLLGYKVSGFGFSVWCFRFRVADVGLGAGIWGLEVWGLGLGG